MLRYFKFFISLIILWFLIHLIVITIDGLSDNYQKTDVALILGNTVKPNGVLSERLKARVDKGAELYKQGFVTKIIVSGGLGKEGYYEADEMRKYLVKVGVKSDDVIVDNMGNTTYLTCKNYTTISRRYNFNSVIVVSQFFHIVRTKIILKSLGVKKVYSAHANYFEVRDVYALCREFFAYYNYFIN